MANVEFCAPCLFGIEGILGDELRRMGAENVRPENGRVLFAGDMELLARANIGSRYAERIQIHLGSFPARSFEELFQGVKALPWEVWIGQKNAFPVKGWALNSALHSVPDCQSIIKKAVVDRLSQTYGLRWFEETGPVCQIQFTILKDEATLLLDTSGAGLHKRGYRANAGGAPIKETLAAAIGDVMRVRRAAQVCDPCCGSGTMLIEAALAAKGRAPGIHRDFAAMQWAWLDKAVWQDAREQARAREFHGDYHIFASDIDPRAVAMARDNARRAGVDDCITFAVADAREFDRTTERGVIVTNPPYGERLMEKREAEALYAAFGAAYAKTAHWKLYLLSSHTEFERTFGRPADKKRKLYNGTLRCDLFQYTKDV